MWDYVWYKTKRGATIAMDMARLVQDMYLDPFFKKIKRNARYVWNLRNNPVLRQRVRELSAHAFSASKGLERFSPEDVYLATDNVFRLAAYYDAHNRSYAPSSAEIMDLIAYARPLTTTTDVDAYHTWRNVHAASRAP